MAPSPPHGSGTRGRDGDSVSLRIRRAAVGACLRRLLLSLGRRNDLPRQDARGLGRCVGLGEPIYDRAEPAGLPLHVLDRPRSPGGGHALAADPGVSPGAGPGSSRADGGCVALHLSLHPGPRGAHLRAFLSRVRPGSWSRDLGARPSGGLRQPDRGPGLANARAQRVLLGPRSASFRLVWRLRRIRRRPHFEGDPARKLDAWPARRTGLVGPSVDPSPDANPDGRRHGAGPVLAPGAPTWLGRRCSRVCDSSALRPLFLSGFRR